MTAFELIVSRLLEWQLVILAVLTLVIASLICKFLFLDAFMTPLRNLPGPPPTLFVGNLLEVQRKGLLTATLEWSKKYGGIFVMWFGPGRHFSLKLVLIKLIRVCWSVRFGFCEVGGGGGGTLSKILYERARVWTSRRSLPV